MNNLFNLTGKKILITGAGFLSSTAFAPAILDYGGTVILVDIDEDKAKEVAKKLNEEYGDNKVIPSYMDITKKETIEFIVSQFEKIDILIHSSAKNPKFGKDVKDITKNTRFENMDLSYWKDSIETDLTGSFLVNQIVGKKMIKQGYGNIINIVSDLAIINQDQSLYYKEGLRDEEQPVKPVSYSVAKAGVVSLSKYLACYPLFVKSNIRVNCLCSGPVFNEEMGEEFIQKLSKKIPSGKLNSKEDLMTALLYLCSSYSTNVTGSVVVVDGGRTII